jgi:hypothetical protein
VRSKQSKRYLYLCIIVLFIILIFIIPFIVNWLMSFSVVKVYGDTNSWIGFLGTYIGSIISGLITFLGVLLTLEFTKKESRRDKLPEKIHNIEECLDFIEDVLGELEVLSRGDFEEILSKFSWERKYKLFEIDENYILRKKDIMNRLDTEYVKKIRNYLVKVNSKSYASFKQFSNRLEGEYITHIKPIDDKLDAFQMEIIDVYQETDTATIISGNLNEIDLLEDHKQMIKEISSNLYYKEQEYIFALANTYRELKNELLEILFELTKEMDF